MFRLSPHFHMTLHCSVIIPQRHAVELLPRQLEDLAGALACLDEPFEVICVEEASRPGDERALAALQDRYPWLRVVRCRPACRTSAALAVGIAQSRGDVVVAVEAGERYPADEMTRLIDRLVRADFVMGRRRLGRIGKLLQSLAHAPRRLLLGREVRDPGCLFWAARREAVVNLPLSRGMSRYLASLVSARGFRVTEVNVDHRPVRHGRTTFDGWHNPFDLLAAWWLRRRWHQPTAEEVFPAAHGSNTTTRRIDPAEAIEPAGRRHAEALRRAPQRTESFHDHETRQP